MLLLGECRYEPCFRQAHCCMQKPLHFLPVSPQIHLCPLPHSGFSDIREWPRYCRKVYWTKMVQNGPNDHFGQNDLIPNRILAFARPKWTKMVHFGPFWPEEVYFGPFRSANRTLAIPETCDMKIRESCFFFFCGQGMKTATSQFSESGVSLNGPDLFTQLPFL